jgi:DnaJ-domain-containing protein 1
MQTLKKFNLNNVYNKGFKQEALFQKKNRIMSSKRDYYEVLGVAKSAGKDEIKKAYSKAWQ